MSNLTFGWIMTVLGMGITLLTLLLLTGVVFLMNKLFPPQVESSEKEKRN